MTSPSTDALIAMLSSETSAERLGAARQLLEAELTSGQIGQVLEAQRLERDAWVRSALAAVLDRLHEDLQPPEAGGSDDTSAVEGIRAQAIIEVSRTVLHEIRPLVGYLRATAVDEIPDYDSSGTKSHVDRLASLLDAIERFGDAARTPVIEEFDLTARILDELALIQTPIEIQSGRNDPVATRGDWDLLRLAFRNGLRNALEASEGKEEPVVVNWGRTDQDAWVAILDQGVGLPSAAHLVFRPGVTTKSKRTNHGWGLAIALRALESCSGSVTLRPRDPRGAVYEMRWPTGEPT